MRVSALVSSAIASVTAACAQNAPTSVYTPVTGIQISSAEVVAGHGCGDAPDQVYKYAALVAAAGDDGGVGDAAPFASNVFDCFSDGLFSNLDGGAFAVTIYAYNRCSFPAALACPADPSAPCAALDAGVAGGAAAAAAANWTTSCTAAQVSSVTSLAACAPLEPTDAGAGCPDASGD